ncbi:hypothetical protein EYW49_19380 [Siculibacillus lacustris]|uniref:Uncharacterized protein n=1 Tax=Siculibacillus lacustris TaxID=1549641 RepID=A0A4Q9VGD9_9HYPH|nr:hypothetical protein [Siculibacillus lacustris]TBW33890.1 hypothetical protein EYW49_19380 [Siculibacillus lacustris]
MRIRWAIAAGLAGLLAVGLVVLRDLASPPPAETSSEPLAVTVGGHALMLPRNVLRFPAQRAGGVQPRLDLALSWPEAEGRTAATAARFDTPGLAPDIVYVTIAAGGDGLDSAGRLATVYGRFFEGEARPGPDGLVGRRLAAASGYAGEEVYLEPGSVHPFVARCYPLAPGEAPSVCLHDEVVDGLAITWRFPLALLADWRRLGDILPARVAAWRAGS